MIDKKTECNYSLHVKCIETEPVLNFHMIVTSPVSPTIDNTDILITNNNNGTYTLTSYNQIDYFKFDKTTSMNTITQIEVIIENLKYLGKTSTFESGTFMFLRAMTDFLVPDEDVFSSVIDFTSAWEDCQTLASFPKISVSSTDTLDRTWSHCYVLPSFPLIDTSHVVTFDQTWSDCLSIVNFPAIDTPSATLMKSVWKNCNSIVDFQFIDMSKILDISGCWTGCESMVSFPMIDTSSCTCFDSAWSYCTNLASFPTIDTSIGTSFYEAWSNCRKLTSFPPIDTSSAISLSHSWVRLLEACIISTN